MEKYKIEVLLPKDVDYQNFPLYANYNWMRAFEEINSIKVQYLVCKKKDLILAYFPIYTRDKFTKSEIVLPFLAIYSQIVYIFPSKKKTIDEIKIKRKINTAFGKFIKNNFSFVNMNLFHDIYDVRGFDSFNLDPLYTYLVNLKNFKLENFTKEIRRDIKKSNELDLTIDRKYDIDLVISLTKETFARNNNDFCYNQKKFRKLLEILKENKVYEQYNVRLNEEVVATHLVIPDKDKVFGFISATKPEFLRKGVNTWLTYNLLRNYTDDYEYFDFCGANISSISKYKEGFNPKIKLFFKAKYMKKNLINFIRKVKNR